MFEDFIAETDKTMKEDITVCKGFALLVVIAAFFAGLIFGAACKCRCKCCKNGKDKEKKCCSKSENDDFNAEEYVESLKFEE